MHALLPVVPRTRAFCALPLHTPCALLPILVAVASLSPRARVTLPAGEQLNNPRTPSRRPLRPPHPFTALTPASCRPPQPQATYLLFEAASGFAVFELLDFDSIAPTTDARVQDSVT